MLARAKTSAVAGLEAHEVEADISCRPSLFLINGLTPLEFLQLLL
jgi:hypothetical protein